jgi:hypothetical protein
VRGKSEEGWMDEGKGLKEWGEGTGAKRREEKSEGKSD